MSKIEFLIPLIKKCLCPQCPVQSKSVCIEGKKRLMLEIVYGNETGMFLEPDRVPGLYCSSGETSCTDIDDSKNCICDRCDVWDDYGLDKMDNPKYFCKKGPAHVE